MGTCGATSPAASAEYASWVFGACMSIHCGIVNASNGNAGTVGNGGGAGGGCMGCCCAARAVRWRLGLPPPAKSDSPPIIADIAPKMPNACHLRLRRDVRLRFAVRVRLRFGLTSGSGSGSGLGGGGMCTFAHSFWRSAIRLRYRSRQLSIILSLLLLHATQADYLIVLDNRLPVFA